MRRYYLVLLAVLFALFKKQETESVEKEPTPKLPDNVIPFKPLSKLEELQKTLQTVNGIEGELNRLLKKNGNADNSPLEK